MPLVGGGGAPNVVGGGAPAGVGSSINYIGNHVYGASGVVSSDGTNELTLLEFNTASQSYIISKVQYAMSTTADVDFICRLYFDNQIVMQLNQRAGSSTNNTEINPSVIDIMLPPETKVKVTMQSGSGGRDFSSVIVGEVYG
jgi:hypothetical protein